MVCKFFSRIHGRINGRNWFSRLRLGMIRIRFLSFLACLKVRKKDQSSRLVNRET